MAEGTPKAIEPKGITRNATKIGVQDGQAEDLINLRFMDGSWRASGNGRQIENMPTGTIYQQLYVHTNIYHHLLGVDNGTLYWFAEIDNDGVTFYPLDNTSDRSQWPEDKQNLPTERKALTTVVGDVWITQTGHLLTIIDENDDFEYFVFKTGDEEYIEVNIDVNGLATDRGIFPFGQAHFNYCFTDDTNHKIVREKTAWTEWKGSSFWDHGTGTKTGDLNQGNIPFTIRQCHDEMISIFHDAAKNNVFTGAFLAVVAIELYDGSYIFTSNPTLICPFEKIIGGRGYYDSSNTYHDEYTNASTNGYIGGNGAIFTNKSSGQWEKNKNVKIYNGTPVLMSDNYLSPFTNGVFTQQRLTNPPSPYWDYDGGVFTFRLMGVDLTLSLDNYDFLLNRGDIFNSVAIFITNPCEFYDLAESAYKKSEDYTDEHETFYDKFVMESSTYSDGLLRTIDIASISYRPPVKSKDRVMYDLFHSPFYLLRKYSKLEINELKTNPIVNLTDLKYEGLLLNLVQQDKLTTEALIRTTYLPKVSYMYNGRLHIANYKTHPFFGYPIDLFHLHNHSVKVEEGSWFKGVLPNLADNNDEYLQYPRTQHTFIPSDIGSYGYGPGASAAASIIKSKGDVFAFIAVEIDTAQGLQKVVRYIKAYNTYTAVNGRADFIEDLNPLLTYPDARAKSMTVFFMTIIGNSPTTTAGVVCWYEKFELKPHPYLNMAYHIDPDLKPIKLRSSTSWNQDANPNDDDTGEGFINSIYRYLDGVAGVDYIVDSEIKEIHPFNAPEMQNTEEYFPNGLKVSKTDQPMFFPVEYTYQVGSAEILALCVNTKALGTGQTGSAPLFVFCKDGIYAQFVDASGQMAYPNARPVADDVCNNPRSVTRTDMGIVFSTDRGLMLATYDGSNFQIEEISAPAEGDVVQFWNAGSVDYSKIATASMQQIAGLPSSLCSTTDFLTYLQDKGTSGKAAIINYNHNMRELMVSNPNYPYSYVLDREGNWSRRDYTAAQYVNNYPTLYRVDADGHFYKVDDEGDANTSLEHRKEADNKIFYLSNVIKLDSIGFKQAYRFVVRGQFETMEGENIACVVEGSYDGRKFRPLGYNRKSGKFRDIGCIVERTDVRFFRVCLSGQVTGKTRIDYMEMSAGASMLNTKIR